ncbi:Similar to mRNA 3' acc. no. Q4IPA4 [Pyronema omphalodes CBS 100304]|uniref:Similar to mRNA 3&apos acc. no. Q4IPA4 n=1 Tax=Pyronema omphalodes (strain CBS 100304) TaxID=1076935 RepID=U4LHV7_PYROM|nr:Similar to mRNA 3' acc. no. Q4IPA4 [Pyronema omphalodes CBS 100304]
MASTAQLEVDPTLLIDSEYGSEISGYDTSTQSLASSVNQYILENGRRYHAYYGENKNMLPSDEIEQDRLDMLHEMFLLLLDRKLHMAPVENPQRILDMGTGTGIWAIDAANEYPEAEVVGVDLSPIQPTWVPPNCRFEVDDLEKEWTYKPNHFDFIFARCIAQAITDWPAVMKQAYRCTKPGGTIELWETGGILYSDDNSMKPDNETKIFYEHIAEAMAKTGRPAHIEGSNLVEYLENAGFVDVVVNKVKLPHGPWAKEKRLKQAGTMALIAFDTGFHSYGMAAFTRILGMSNEEADKLCYGGLNAVRNRANHTYTYLHIVYGRKPEESK